MIKHLIHQLGYSGKCNDYDDEGNLLSHLFSDATEMAQVVESEEVVTLTAAEFTQLVIPGTHVHLGNLYQVHPEAGIAWVYNETDDIHYFYSL